MINDKINKIWKVQDSVEYTHLKNCYGLYDPNNKKLQIDKDKKVLNYYYMDMNCFI